MNTRKTLILAAMVLALAMMPLTAQAANYTWTGTASNAWNHDTNWGQTSGSGLFPGSVVGSYADTATIGVSSNNPVSLSTTALLGGGGTALTIGTGSSGTSADLDIASGGTLGMQGNLFITTPTTGSNKNRSITIEGTLRNDSASPGTNYSISGTTTGSHGTETVTLNGGTMSSLNGGGWTFATSDPVSLSGWGTISAPLTVVSNTAFTVSGGILDLNNSLTATANYKGVTVNSGGTLNINTGAC